MQMFMKNGSVSDGDHRFGLGRIAVDLMEVGVVAPILPVIDCEKPTAATSSSVLFDISQAFNHLITGFCSHVELMHAHAGMTSRK